MSETKPPAFNNRDGLVNQERDNALNFLACEAKELPQWKEIYKYKLEEFSITEKDVQDRITSLREERILDKNGTQSSPHFSLISHTSSSPSALGGTNAVGGRGTSRGLSRGLSGGLTGGLSASLRGGGTSRTSKKHDARNNEIIIYCWPYHAEAVDGTAFGRVRHVDPIVTIVTVFASAWIIATIIILGMHLHFYNWTLLKGLPVVILPLLAKLKGMTHIRLNKGGIVLESTSGKVSLAKKHIGWWKIEKIYVDMPKKSKSPLAGNLILQLNTGQKQKIPLKKIASAEQWRNFVFGVSKFLSVKSLDPALLDGLNQGATRDPSYTRLWLDALSAPPKRERLQPLDPGVELQKGQYKIQQLLGAGGQGSAYLALDSNSNQQVVLKEYILPVYVDVKVKKQALEDFEHEAKILASLNHKNIVRSLGSFIEDHRAYLILEYIQGKSLQQQVRDNGPLPQAEGIEYALQMCEILDYLHSQVPAVVHQDFTPDNLLIAPDGSLRLIDFMVAKQAASESATGLVVGKHHYMPPEQFRGKATASSDIFAFGGTLHFMLTGSEPEPMSTSHPILLNENIAGGLNSIVEKSTMLNQDDRYDSAQDISHDLKAVQAALREQTL